MDHNEALKNHAAEKYFLGELDSSQRDAFEEHFFQCDDCAADVKTTALLVDNVREVLRTAPALKKAPSREPRTSGFLTWWRPAYSFAAVALLLVTVGYQNFVQIPQIRRGSLGQAETLETFSFVTSGSRGENAMEIAVPTGRPFGIYVDVPGDPSFRAYSADILTSSGVLKLSIPISAEQTRDTVQLLIPGSLLAEGQYELVIRGYKADSPTKEGQEITRHPFVLRRK